MLGIFGRRVMGLGLPLLYSFSRSELRAVLAHEFGHRYGGDTLLGSRVSMARSAIGRTLAALEGNHSCINALFELYADLCMRVTRVVSRHQEVSAAALGCRVASAATFAGARRRPVIADPAFNRYRETELARALEVGLRPPLVEGFRQPHDRASFTARPR